MKTRKKLEKVIVILGPTSAGKTALSIRLAKTVGGDVVSADSRQVYRGLNIGTGKVTKREMRGIRHHLLNVADPAKQYSASMYVRDARRAIADILSRGRVPIITGGTGFYIDALLGVISLPDVPPNVRLRKKLAGKQLSWLQQRLKKLDPVRYREIDSNNPVRLIRAIEIAERLGTVPRVKNKPLYDVLYLGIAVPFSTLKKKISKRLKKRLRSGMLREVRGLRRNGVPWKRLHELGLEYRYAALHLEGKLSKDEFANELEREIARYAKRQMTWFKRNKKIHWLAPSDIRKATGLSKKFLGLRKFSV